MMGWKEFRKRKYAKYKRARENGDVDRDIIPLLDLINSTNKFITLSSCSGRIGILDTPKPGDKLNSVFLAKWHQGIKPQQVVEVAKNGKQTTWLISSSPILHISCKNLESAGELMEMANDARFSRSGIISLKKNIVAITSHERMEVPISRRGSLLIDENLIESVVELANEKMEKGKEKLTRLEQIMSAPSNGIGIVAQHSCGHSRTDRTKNIQ